MDSAAEVIGLSPKTEDETCTGGGNTLDGGRLLKVRRRRRLDVRTV